MATQKCRQVAPVPVGGDPPLTDGRGTQSGALLGKQNWRLRACVAGRPSGPLAAVPKNALQAGGPGARGRCAVPLHAAEHTPMRKKIRMTGGDTQERRLERMVQIPNRRGPVDTPHLFCPVEDGSNPGGDRDAPNDPNPPLWVRGREREKERERGLSTVGKDHRGTTGEREQERAREIGRERVGERPSEQETGANRHKGRVVGSS